MFVALVVGVLALGSQVVLSFDSIIFSSIQQCGSFNVTFAGSRAPTALPLSLTIIPFNSTPLSIPIPDTSWDAQTSAGAAITFLPFGAGTTFVASLDDATGSATGNVSDVIQIQPSTNSSCVSTPSSNNRAQYAFVGTLAQCQPFNVTYNTRVVTETPSVRAFEPMGHAFSVNQTALASPGTATYMMNAPGGATVVLSVNDDSGHQQTSLLQSVQGNSFSSTACLPSELPQSSMTIDNKRTSLSRGAVIAIATGTSLVVLGVALLMIFYIYRERRRRPPRSSFSIANKGDLPPLPPKSPFRQSISPLPTSSRFIPNRAPYGNEAFASPSPDFISKSRTPSRIGYGNSMRGSAGHSRFSLNALSKLPQGRNRNQSISSIDIERILEMATVYSTRSNRTSLDARPNLRRGRERDPYDVPVPADPIVSGSLSPGRTTSFFPDAPSARDAADLHSGAMRGRERSHRFPVSVDAVVATPPSKRRKSSGRPFTTHATQDSVDTQSRSLHSDTSSSLSPRSITGNTPPLFTTYLGDLRELPDLPSSAMTYGSLGEALKDETRRTHPLERTVADRDSGLGLERTDERNRIFDPGRPR